MSEPVAGTHSELPDDGPAPKAMEFPGCRPVRVRREELDDYGDRRFEYWDSRTEIAMVAENPTTHHEYGAMRLASCGTLIAAKRGAPIDLIGAAALVVRGAGGQKERVMSADQVVYVHPAEARPRGGEIAYGVDALPDVVLEVDYSTDVRQRKLSIYQSWGFPEVFLCNAATRTTSSAAPPTWIDRLTRQRRRSRCREFPLAAPGPPESGSADVDDLHRDPARLFWR